MSHEDTYPPKTWEEAAQQASRLVLVDYKDRAKRMSSPLTPHGIDQQLTAIESRLGALKDALDRDDHEWQKLEYRGIGSLGLIGYVGSRPGHQVVTDVMDEIVRVLASKQHDYGEGNISAYGSFGLAVRLNDKVARLQNLRKRGVPANEAVTDTWLDIVGYSIIGLMWEMGTFSLPLAADVQDVNSIRSNPVPFPNDNPEASPYSVQDEEFVRSIARDEYHRLHSQAVEAQVPLSSRPGG